MTFSLEPLFCPCCTPAILHALSQYGSQVFTQPLMLLGSSSLSAAIKLNQSAAIAPDHSPLESVSAIGSGLPVE